MLSLLSEQSLSDSNFPGAAHKSLFFAVWITFAVCALLYHSLRVKNTTITESGLFLQDQVHSSHNVPPSKVKSSQKRQVTWRILR
jgi:hypothetical protein